VRRYASCGHLRRPDPAGRREHRGTGSPGRKDFGQDAPHVSEAGVGDQQARGGIALLGRSVLLPGLLPLVVQGMRRFPVRGRVRVPREGGSPLTGDPEAAVGGQVQPAGVRDNGAEPELQVGPRAYGAARRRRAVPLQQRDARGDPLAQLVPAQRSAGLGEHDERLVHPAHLAFRPLGVGLQVTRCLVLGLGLGLFHLWRAHAGPRFTVSTRTRKSDLIPLVHLPFSPVAEAGRYPAPARLPASTPAGRLRHGRRSTAAHHASRRRRIRRTTGSRGRRTTPS